MKTMHQIFDEIEEEFDEMIETLVEEAMQNGKDQELDIECMNGIIEMILCESHKDLMRIAKHKYKKALEI